MVDYGKWDRMSRTLDEEEKESRRKRAKALKSKGSVVDTLGNDLRETWKKHYGNSDDPRTLTKRAGKDREKQDAEYKKRVEKAWESKMNVDALQEKIRSIASTKYSRKLKTMTGKKKKTSLEMKLKGYKIREALFSGYGNEREEAESRSDRSDRRRALTSTRLTAREIRYLEILGTTIFAALAIGSGEGSEMFGYWTRRIFFLAILAVCYVCSITSETHHRVCVGALQGLSAWHFLVSHKKSLGGSDKSDISRVFFSIPAVLFAMSISTITQLVYERAKRRGGDFECE